MREIILKNYEIFIENLMNNNGPDQHQYNELSNWYNDVGNNLDIGILSKNDIDDLRNKFGSVFVDNNSLQGRIFNKPLGYSGDYIVIDKIYTNSTSQNPIFKKWDLYTQSLPACEAVRNRKEYFIKIMKKLSKTKCNLSVLNLASGSCRDIIELFEYEKINNIEFDCVDFDQDAIEYAKKKLSVYSSKVNFIHKNILKFRTTKKYDIIWSAGMFDYLNDKLFKYMLSNISNFLKKDGKIVIGNFHPRNPSKRAMEFGEWYLQHRNEAQLIELASSIGTKYLTIDVFSEDTGINLFLHIENS
ncbi:MAG: class I SAM-dependent methyltransferase [Candidatus Cloacimonetes bacterium]|nr:class I SAM-dependent methyltransferase [Candidatus Cloacimonadota bacterium]